MVSGIREQDPGSTGTAPAAGAGQGCFHCGLPLPGDRPIEVEIDGVSRPMCCPGCAAVARTIVEAGLGDFYRHRTAPAPTGQELVPAAIAELSPYDHPSVQAGVVRADEHGLREASLILEGITCAACLWLNERHLASLPGVRDVRVNYATHRATVKWDEDRVRLSGILAEIRRIGYEAHPYDPQRRQAAVERERRDYLRRLGVAGALGMQVMVLAVALYSGAWQGIESAHRQLFAYASLVLATPVVLYAAQPFFAGAWRSLRNRQPGMDVPVTAGIVIAFLGSLHATITGAGEVYYDSVVMFVFLLLGARFLELGARKRAGEQADALARTVPARAVRLVARQDGDAEEVVPSAELRAGDRVLVRPGETVPADARVLHGTSSVDESLLTGESMPVSRGAGDTVMSGSTNVESPLVVAVERTGTETVVSQIVRLLERAQTERPAVARLANRVASWFVAFVLILGAAVAAYWWQADPARWLPVTVAVLVVACPCALSLATPSAMTAALGTLMRDGILVTRGDAVETLARATHVVFDKTGTLTRGELAVVDVTPAPGLSAEAGLRLAAALEQYSEHPVAQALRSAAGVYAVPGASDVEAVPGAGLRGRVQGRDLYVGSEAFVCERAGVEVPEEVTAAAAHDGRTVVMLAERDRWLAVFTLDDTVRPEAVDVVARLAAEGRQVWLVTGDQPVAANRVARAVGIANVRAGCLPREKLDIVRGMQRRGAVVAMVGDGVNDAPVLAGADVSLALGGGAQLAAASADMVLMGDDLQAVLDARGVSRRAMRVIRQNLSWAAGYNLLAVPAAAAGLVAPWLAAVGMSLSSLLVVANALRLAGRRRR